MFVVDGAGALDLHRLDLAGANDIRQNPMDCAGIIPYWDLLLADVNAK